MSKKFYPKRISFFRDYQGYTGGHQKVHDYIEHTLSASVIEVDLYLSAKSRTRPDLFSNFSPSVYQSIYDPTKAELVFLAGMDWHSYLPFYDEAQSRINLIQHVRHADPSQPLFEFLQYPATRICVSEAVRQAILPYANGRCITIKMGHVIPKLKRKKCYDLYILANKRPALGQRLFEWAQKQNWKVKLHASNVAPLDVYQAMASSRISLPLPNKTEGFYLPGIEAMSLSDWAVVPDCVANREYESIWANITLCEPDFESCCHAITKAAQRVGSPLLQLNKWIGKQKAYSYSLAKERAHYLNVLKGARETNSR
ncbi:hypothetical protein IC617_10145 [Neiella sp. HB171785]|uniref:Uncharacterized protein n=1 Tax=Neiella litorisoli TaxID=2771431 RepID=A0A8J6QKL0_9GAMM|nr:hypothetical protein [Neiella litorisoli]MBD1389787.1 hypothetical protein [Neiella litorisoli]